MGFTHHDKISGVNGVYTGALGSEKLRANASGVYNGSGTPYLMAEKVTFSFFSNTAAAISYGYFYTPFAGTVSAVVSSTASDGSARTVTITNCSGGTGGAVILSTGGTAFATSQTTAFTDTAQAMVASAGSTACVANTLYRVACPAVAEGTAQVIACVVTVTRNA